ncbi:protein of unknown function [Enterobacter cancerogenus]|nr:protein of unknown function [Enterobacter cancerogenus]
MDCLPARAGEPDERWSVRANRAGKSNRTRAVTGIDGDVKLNRALWVMAENMLEFFGR